MNMLQTKIWQKLLFTVSAVLISPLAQAHDNSQSTGLLAHIWAHGVEMINTNVLVILGVVTILAGLFAAARLRTTATTATTATAATAENHG